MKWGIDGGNYNINVANEHGVFGFISCLGEYRDRKLDSVHGEDDIIYEYKGEKGFAGTLAKYESELLRKMKGLTKSHDDAKLRVLLAIHRYGGYEKYHDIVVGQPIISHDTAQKSAIKQMLKGSHEITVNGESKSFIIRNVEVAAEGAGAYWSVKMPEGEVRIIDVGSGTINLATIDNKRYVDKGSTTLEFGANTTKSKDIKAMANAINAETSGNWSPNDNVFVVGGMAEKVLPYISEYYTNAKLIKPMYRNGTTIKNVHPVYGNAIGFYNLSRVVFDD